MEVSKMICPHCAGKAFRDLNWTPPPGFDPKLRRYVCSDDVCGIEFYTTRAVVDKGSPVPGIPTRTASQSTFSIDYARYT